jgi:hypothetical protein
MYFFLFQNISLKCRLDGVEEATRDGPLSYRLAGAAHPSQHLQERKRLIENGVLPAHAFWLRDRVRVVFE